ncbi:hypothetical protein HanIR_Chr02g0058981 [Helianthus annuus]|nr:hypothetical protein HanIR_Chr02g0058981 [Helianthus annuus]
MFFCFFFSAIGRKMKHRKTDIKMQLNVKINCFRLIYHSGPRMTFGPNMTKVAKGHRVSYNLHMIIGTQKVIPSYTRNR